MRIGKTSDGRSDSARATVNTEAGTPNEGAIAHVRRELQAAEKRRPGKDAVTRPARVKGFYCPDCRSLFRVHEEEPDRLRARPA
jgi:hypothetical protein